MKGGGGGGGDYDDDDFNYSFLIFWQRKIVNDRLEDSNYGVVRRATKKLKTKQKKIGLSFPEQVIRIK
jgi:hypothetical protein